MKAAYIESHGGPECLRVGELPTPEPGPGEARVAIRAASVNHLDIWVRKGLPGLKLRFPHILGGDAAGVVDKLGPGVNAPALGSEVIVHPGLADLTCASTYEGWESLCPGYRILGEHVSGTHAEYVVVPVENLFPKPKSLRFEEAASIGLVFTTAWQMLVRRARVEPGETVLVHAAASGVSAAGIQIAKLFGARVIAVASTDEKLAYAKKLGADDLILSSRDEFAQELKKIAPQGVEIIFDHVGEQNWEKNIRALKSGGRIVLCGATTGRNAPLDLAHVFYRQLSILGSTMGSKADFPQILGLFEKGRFQAPFGMSFPLAEAAKAYARIEQRRAIGKIILTP